MYTPHDRDRPCGRFAWADVPVLCLAFAAAWYLSHYEHYSVPVAVATSAATLGLFAVVLSAPSGVRRAVTLLTALSGTPATAAPELTTSVIVGEPAGPR
ncbi:hypothetical protein FHS29_005097 [Saccharothrix tamanrassetensis]|uniref:Uncharacterized protein n=1 Tax=Saccharothrix tamanrassetensis TaxID=1051531 RepID=A0A841CMG8_9PSEU|nr:hypothetical protein [Saccharothrix tamanrassetensis]MBB5958489.1 hypothetical protein [Saccharothrix tamanrassetensis]